MSGPTNASAFMAPNPRTRMQRLFRRLFPSVHLVASDDPAFSTHTTVQLDWKDRLRVLVSGCIRLEYRHVTDVEVKSVSTSCVFFVESPLERPIPNHQLRDPVWPR